MERVDWSWVNRSPVDRNWVNGSWMYRCRVGHRFVGWAWVSYSLVFDVGYIATITGNIGMVVNNLYAAIRQSNPIISCNQGTIRSLILTEVDSRVLIKDAVLKCIGLGRFSITVGSRVVNWCRVN